MNRLTWRPARATLPGLAGWTVLAVIVVFAVRLLARPTDDGRPHHLTGAHAAIGTVYGLTTSSNPHDPVGSVVVRVPTAAARLTVYTRTDEAYLRNGSDDDTFVRAPSDGQLFTVASTASASGLSPSAIVAGRTTSSDATVTLVADGRRYRVDPGTDSTKSFTSGVIGGWSRAIGVRGAPKDVRLDIAFDGVTQTFDLTRHTRELGRAAPLYTTANSRPGSCGTPDRAAYPVAAGAVGPQCRVQLHTVPWAPGYGWAPAGRAWPLVSLAVSPPSLVRSPAGVGLQPRRGSYSSTLTVQVAGRDGFEVGGSSVATVEAAGVRHFVGRAPVVPSATVPVVISASFRVDAITDSAARAPGDELLRWATTLG